MKKEESELKRRESEKTGNTIKMINEERSAK